MLYTLEFGLTKQKLSVAGSLLIAGVLAFAASATIFDRTSAAPATKVDVCHSTGDGDYQKISISENALQKHLDNHGDALPGQQATDVGDLRFTDNCDAWRLVDEVKVPVTNGGGVDSVYQTVLDVNYSLEVSGQYRYQRGSTYGIADAEWAYRNDAYALPVLPHGWTKGEESYPSIKGLDVLVDEQNIDWGDFSDVHEYHHAYIGTGNSIHFSIYDSAYADNSDIDNGLVVKIYEMQ